jgi:hypothetical protein
LAGAWGAGATLAGACGDWAKTDELMPTAVAAAKPRIRRKFIDALSSVVKNALSTSCALTGPVPASLVVCSIILDL